MAEMGVFEDIFLKAKGAVDAIGEKAGQYVDVSKLNIKLMELKGDLKNEYENLGKLVHKCAKSGEDGKSEINVSIAQIDNIGLRIEELKKQIATLKNKVLCKTCEHLNEQDSVFCAKCGQKLSKPENLENSQEIKEEDDDFRDFDD